MTEQQEQIIHALEAAAEGISAAVEQESITSIEIYCLLKTLIKQLHATLN